MDQFKRTQEISRLAKHLRKAEFLTIGGPAFTGRIAFTSGFEKASQLLGSMFQGNACQASQVTYEHKLIFSNRTSNDWSFLILCYTKHTANMFVLVPGQVDEMSFLVRSRWTLPNDGREAFETVLLTKILHQYVYMVKIQEINNHKYLNIP